MVDHNADRREFLNLILGGGILATLGAIVYPVYKYLVPPSAGEANISQLKLAFKREDIAAEPKKAKYFKFGRQMGIIILSDDDKLVALSATCTHLDCTVQNRPDLGLIWCSCHNGKYSLTGQNISGPPPKPLEPFVVNEIDGNIFISKGDAS